MPTVLPCHRRDPRDRIRAASRAVTRAGARAFTGIALAIATATATGIAACSGGIPSVSTDISTRQAMLDLGQNLVDVREENAALQSQVDSLRGAVAYQDTVLRQLAGLAGVAVRPPAFVVP